VIGRITHIRESHLLDCYFAERGGEPVDPRFSEHLADCEACAFRYADLTRFMDGLRDQADDETDTLFTTDQLIAQQRQIARRIEHAGRAARVITFPDRASIRPADTGARRSRPRWVAAAVAAGLFVGLGLGATLPWDRQNLQPQQLTVGERPAAAPRLAPVATGGVDAMLPADYDAFLSDLEIALERPRTRELQALDAVTPHLREITNVQ
jgi:hypothetical protein